ncbi:MAG: hypothetical protein ACKO81_12955, partial [Planctomycetota bacterium]
AGRDFDYRFHDQILTEFPVQVARLFTRRGSCGLTVRNEPPKIREQGGGQGTRIVIAWRCESRVREQTPNFNQLQFKQNQSLDASSQRSGNLAGAT